MFRITDKDARNIISIIQAERIAEGGLPFSTAECDNVHTKVMTFKNAIDENGISAWDKTKAFYGFVGGTASAHKWNWKDMRDLDDAFRLTFPNNATHDNLGVKFTTAQWGDTYVVISNLASSNIHLSFYKTTPSTNNGGNDIRAGDAQSVFLRGGGRSVLSASPNSQVDFPSNTGNGFILSSKIGSNHFVISRSIVYNTPIQNNNTNSGALKFYLGGLNASNGVATAATGAGYGFASLGLGLTEQQALQVSHGIYVSEGILSRQ